MKEVGTAASTTEGWGAILLVIFGVVKQFGWLPEGTDIAQLVVAIVLVAGTVVAVLKKAFRKGSVPFVADPVAPKP